MSQFPRVFLASLSHEIWPMNIKRYMNHQWLVIDLYFIEDDVKVYIKSLKINKSSTRINILKAIVIKIFFLSSFIYFYFLFIFVPMCVFTFFATLLLFFDC